MFVDYAGMTMPITNPKNGLVHKAQIFVAVLGASLYVYAEATMSQQLQDWVMSHCRAFKFFGGVPERGKGRGGGKGIKCPLGNKCARGQIPGEHVCPGKGMPAGRHVHRP